LVFSNERCLKILSFFLARTFAAHHAVKFPIPSVRHAVWLIFVAAPAAAGVPAFGLNTDT
jgi:hypothetical protein